MLVFIVPVKSQKVSNSWELVSKLFERTLKSLCHQNSPDFRAIVVCHEKPLVEFNHPHVTYVEVDFPAPAPDSSYQLKELDKGRKILTGLFHARKFNPTHTMIVDADDCVSKNLAKFVSQNPQHNGWFVDKGYVYQQGSKFIYFRNRYFNKWCGTCNIVRYDLQEVPEDIDKIYPELNSYYGNHRKVADIMYETGREIVPLPFPGALYTIGNQENIYQTGFQKIHGLNQGILFKMKDAFNYRLLTRSIREEFSFYELEQSL